MRRPVVPFQITLGPQLDEGRYAVTATLRGEETAAEVEIPPWLLDLSDELLALGQPPLPIPDPEEVAQTLGRALFAPPLRTLLLHAAREAADSGARLQIRLQLAAYELAALPWEWLTLGQANSWTPALREDYPLVRVSRRTRPAPPAAVSGPLRVLAVAARGEEVQLHALEAALGEELRAGVVALRLLENATPAALERALASAPFHVLHLAAPAGLTHDERLELALGPGVEADELAELLGVAEELRLVTLAGTHSGRREGGAARLAVGPGLLGSVLLDSARPATVAFGGPLAPELGALFAAGCYAELASGAPADLAVTIGRQTIAARSKVPVPLPQLRLLPGAERLFELRPAPRATSRTISAAARRSPGTVLEDEEEPPLGGALPGWIGDGWRRALLLRPWSFAVLAATAAALALLLLFGGRLFTQPGDPDARAAEQSDGASSTADLPGGLRNPFAPTPTPEPPPTPSPPPEPSGYVSAVAAEGETGAQIAARLGGDPLVVAAYNRIDPEVALSAGRQLIVPVYALPAEPAAGAVVTQGNTAAPSVALTFDIELDDASLYGILEVLRARGVKGTFFVTGRWVERYPDAARAIVADGHEVANHSLTHPYFSQIGLDGAASEIRETERIVREVTGATTRPYFRFPYGDSTPETEAVVTAEGYVAYHWSADDDAISGWIAGLGGNAAGGNGAILLMHGRDSTVARLPGWLDQLQALGLQPATLSEVLR
jgi:peptidoglycan-N-acetylglucosamine deacetylase